MNNKVNPETISNKAKTRDVSHYSYALDEKDDVTHGFDKARFSGLMPMICRSGITASMQHCRSE